LCHKRSMIGTRLLPPAGGVAAARVLPGWSALPAAPPLHLAVPARPPRPPRMPP
jgi:hypothetical protein